MSTGPRMRDWVLIVGVAQGPAWLDALESLHVEAHLGTLSDALEQMERHGEAAVVVLGEGDPDGDSDDLDALWESLTDHPEPPALAFVGTRPRKGAALQLAAEVTPEVAAAALRALVVQRRPQGFQAQLQALSQDFGQRLPGRLDELKVALEALRGAPGDAALLTQARSLAHKLAGIAGSMGYGSVGDATRGLDDLLMDAARHQTILDWARIDALFDSAQRSLLARR